MSFRVVFCGTPPFAVPALQALFDSPQFTVVKVLSQPDRPAGRGKKLKASAVKTFALENNLDVITPKTCKDPELWQTIKKLNADLAVVVAFGQILPQDFLDLFPKGCVNIHGSLLPRWRGAAPIQRAIMAGDAETGVSLQKMVFKLDAGDVIGERKIPLDTKLGPEDEELGSKELFASLSQLGAEMMGQELVEYLEGRVTPQPQDESLVTHAKKISKDEAELNWQLSATEVHNKVRGLNAGGPYALTKFRDKQLKVHRTIPVGGVKGSAGEVFAIEQNSFKVYCGDGAVELLIVQPESKSKMSAGDFARGFQLQEGEKLG